MAGMPDAAHRIARLEDRLAGHWTAEQVKEYLEGILDEKDRALSMADDEREKAASALRGEQQRAHDQAEREREKAAQALRDEMARAVKEGDDRLREHIANQIMQIRESLISSDKLEAARIDAVTSLAKSVQREVLLQSSASDTAIAKAEVATDKRFESVNEFRAEARQVREAQEKALAVLSSSLLPRETFDSVVEAWTTWRAGVEERLNKGQGSREGASATIAWAFAVLGALGTAVGLILGFN